MAARKPTPARVPPTDKRIEKRKVADLRPYHRQDQMFHPLPDDEFDRLKRSIAKRLNDPIEITTDDRIIDGHQRHRAVGELGWEEVAVWVRDDLTADEIELRHLDANEHRRQLDMLDQVRLGVRRYEIEVGRKPGGLFDWEYGALKRRVAKLIGKTPRHTQRLFNVIAAPMEVQSAFSQGKLRVELAEKVCKLPKHVQAKIAAEIRAGGDPAAIVSACLPKPKPKATALRRVLAQLVAALARGMEDLDGRVGEIERSTDDLTRDVDVLNRSAPFLRSLARDLKAKRATRARIEKEIAAIADAFGRPRPGRQGRRSR